jgi:Predicted Zn-dependent peptidases
LNRPIPQIKTVQHVPIPKFSQTKLKNGIPLIIVDKGTTPALNLIVEFRAGRFLETNRLTSNVCASLLKEGSQQYTGSEIDEIFDFLGATIQVSSNLDFIKLSVYCLTKHLELLLPYILDIILYPTFSDKELKRYKKNVKNQLIINLDKKNIIAYRELTEKLFGKAHPYGYNSTIEGYEALQREQVKDFHKKVFIAEQCKVYVAGGLEENTIDLLEQSLQEIPNGTKLVAPTFETPSEVPNRVTIKGKKSNQAAIRMGWRSIGKAHPDYPDLLILNTILGGFFGSRLMTNIREEKGIRIIFFRQ